MKPLQNKLSGLLGDLLDGLGGGGGMGGGFGGGLIGLALSFIPGFASGNSFVSSPTLAMIGEGREGEFVLTESQMSNLIKNVPARGSE